MTFTRVYLQFSLELLSTLLLEIEENIDMQFSCGVHGLGFIQTQFSKGQALVNTLLNIDQTIKFIAS
jgi:hypothetical protein